MVIREKLFVNFIQKGVIIDTNPIPNKNNSIAAFKKPSNYSLILPALRGVKWSH